MPPRQQKSDSERRTELIELYRSKLIERAAITVKYAKETEMLMERFAIEDEKLEEALNGCVADGEELGLFAFQVTETFDTDQIEDAIADFADQLEDDARTLPKLRKEAKEADEEDERGGDDEDDDDEGDDEDEEELDDEDE